MKTIMTNFQRQLSPKKRNIEDEQIDLFRKLNIPILSIVVSAVLITAFQQLIFSTPKDFATMQIDAFFKQISSTRHIISKNDFDIKDQKYAIDIDVSKEFAYKNNLPYYDELSAEIEIGNKDNKEYGFNVRLLSQEENIGELDILSKGDYVYYYVPVADRAYRYDKIQNDTPFNNSSLFAYIVNEASFTPEEGTELLNRIINDIVENLPDECFSYSPSIFGKAKLIISAKDKEMGRAIAATLTELKKDDLFQRILNGAFSEKDLDSFIEGLSNIEAPETNICSFCINTDIFGNPYYVSFSYIQDGLFKEYSLGNL